MNDLQKQIAELDESNRTALASIGARVASFVSAIEPESLKMVEATANLPHLADELTAYANDLECDYSRRRDTVARRAMTKFEALPFLQRETQKVKMGSRKGQNGVKRNSPVLTESIDR